MQNPQMSRSMELRDYLAILRARKWTIVLVTALVIGAAMLVSYWQTPIYGASSKLIITPSDAQPLEATVKAVDVPTETQLIDSEAIAVLVQEDLGIDASSNELLANLSVRNITDTFVVQLTYQSDDPQEAADVAQSFAESYIAYRREQSLDDLQAAQTSVQERLEDVNSQIQQLNSDIRQAAQAGDESLRSTLDASRNILLARLGLLQERLDDLQPSQVLQFVGIADVIQTASVPSRPMSPSYPRNAALAMFLGLALGVGLALLRERLDDRFRGREDIEHSLGAPVLAAVPRFTGPRREGASQLVTQSEPRALASEFYRTLRTNLDVVASEGKVQSFLVTSPSSVEGKSVTAANLSVVFAQAGSRVILVSADLRRPTLERMFGIGESEGLSTWLQAEDDNLTRLIADPGILNLRVLPSGPVPSRPAELLASPRLNRLVEMLNASCDYLIFDTPPCLIVSDAAILASKLDASLLVIDAAKTPRSAGIRAKEELDRAGSYMLGAVLNSFDPQGSPYYRYDSPYYGNVEDINASTAAGGPRRRRLSIRR